MRYCIALLCIAVLAAACSTTSGTRAVRGDTYFITADEIAKTQATNAYQVVQVLRPQLLNYDKRRGIDMYGQAEALVYVDGSRFGTKETMKQIPTFEILTIKFVPPTDAVIRYGTTAAGGVFEITLKR